MNGTTIRDLNDRAERAAAKYGDHANVYEAYGALLCEVQEVLDAIQERKPWKVREEMLDVANVCIRWAEQHDAKRTSNDTNPV